MMKEERKTRIGAYGILKEDSKILLVKHQGGPFQGCWGLPGGEIEFGESPEASLKREFLEEVNFELVRFKLVDTSSYTLNFNGISFHHLGLLYSVEEWRLFSTTGPTEEWAWLEMGSLPESSLAPMAWKIVKDYQNSLIFNSINK